MKRITIKEFFFNLVFFYETGKGRTIGRIWGSIAEIMIILVFFQQRGLELSYFQIAILLLALAILVTLIGREYVRRGIYKYERTIDNKQNQELMQIKEDVEEIKKCLTEIKKSEQLF